MQRHAHALVRAQQFEVLAETLRGVTRQQQEMRTRRIRRPSMEAGVEFVHFVERDSRKLRGEREVELAARVDLHEVRLVRNRAERDAVVLGIRNEPAHREELWYIGAGFGRQMQAEEIDRLASGAIGIHFALHAEFAAIVRGDG